MEEFLTLISYIQWYLLGAIGIGILVVVVILIKRFYEKLAKCLFIKIKNYFTNSNTHHTRSVIGFVDDLVKETRIALKADRCYIFEFHNGKKFESNTPMWRITQTYEDLSEGISSQGLIMANLNISMLWKTAQVYYSHENDQMPSGISIIKPQKPYCKKSECKIPSRLYLINVEEISSSYSKSIFERQGTKYMIHIPIIKESGDIVGVMGVDYLNKQRFEKFFEDENFSPCLLHRAADQVSYSWAVVDIAVKKNK